MNMTQEAVFKEYKLANQLTILLKEQHALPIVSTMIWYKVGSRNEITGQTGISHFLEHILFKGTDRYKKGDIDLITALNGGDNNAFTWLDCTAYYFNFASDRWEIALEIEANRMRNNLFNPEEIEAERSVILSEWQMTKDSPEENLSDLVTSTAIQAHPYHNPIIGWKQDIEQITAKQLENYYQTFYHPNNATLVLVGDFKIEEVLPKIEKLFGSIPAGPATPLVHIQEPEQTGERRVMLKKEDATLPRIQIVYPAPNIESEDIYPLILLDHILSHGYNSILNQSLVEQQKLATDIDSYFFSTHDPYIFSISAELSPDQDMAEVEKALDQEIIKLQTDTLPQEILNKAINQVIADHYFSHETYEGQANFMGEIAVIANYKKAENYIDKLKQVTLEDLKRVAQTYLQVDKRTVGWLIPLELEEEPEERETETPTQPVKANYDKPPVKLSSSIITAKTLPKLPEFTRIRHQLNNGLLLLLHENPLTPIVKIRLYCKTGTIIESEEKAGLANLTAELLLKGTLHSTAQELAERIEAVGGSMDIATSILGVSLSIKILQDHVTTALKVINECLRWPLFSEEEIAKEKRQIQNYLIGNEEDPNYVARQAFKKLIYQEHPAYRVIAGHQDSILQLTRDDIVDFYQTYYEPHQLIFSIAGGINASELIQQCEAIFGDWNRGNSVFNLPPHPQKQTCKLEQVITVAGKEQVHIYLGHLGITRNNPDYYALEVLDTILGAGPGFTSRIPARLRDEQGLAYSTFSSIAGYASLYPGMFVTYIGTSLEKKEQSIQGLLREIELIRQAPVTDDELTVAKGYLTGNCVFDYETCSQLTDYMLEQEVYNLSPQYIQEYPQHIQQVTKEDILRVAQEYIDPDNYSLVVTQSE